MLDDASAAAGRYTDNGDGTVTDTSTGLMWQQAGSSGTWEQALAYCEGLNLGGYTNWRLPTSKELQSLVDYSRYNPAIDTTYFSNVAGYLYWSSTPPAYGTDYAWLVHFHNGSVSTAYKYPTNYVRAVRGGQYGPLGDLVIAQQPMSGPPGTTFVEWGTGFTPNSTATLHFKKPDGTEYPTLQQSMDAIGHFEINYTAPWDKPPGTYTWWAIDGVTGAKSNVVSYTITSLTTGSLVAASFTGSGLYIYNSLSETWSIVNSINPENVIYSDSTLYVDFGALGLYKWSGGSWAPLTAANPENMVASGSMLYVDFGASGLYQWNGTAWSKLTGSDPVIMVISN